MKVKIVWRGEPGHFCGSRGCCFFLHTEVRPATGRGTWYRVSTVGCYHTTIVAPNQRSIDNRQTLGSDPEGYYETFVFVRDENSEVEGRRYKMAEEAEAAHANAVERYAAKVRG